jgi:hypothetical protein
MADPALDIPDDLSGCALVPLPIEELSPEPELHEQIAGNVFRFRLASLLRQRRCKAGSSFPIIIRASEPQMNDLRKVQFSCLGTQRAICLHLLNRSAQGSVRH